jgi:hypothetical protein
LRPPTPALVALGGIGAILSLAAGPSSPTIVCGLALSVSAIAAGSLPVTSAVLAWLAAAWSLVNHLGIDLPVYLLVGVPLWAVARYSAPRWVVTGAVGGALGGLLAAAYAAMAPLHIRWLVGLFKPFGWTVWTASWS